MQSDKPTLAPCPYRPLPLTRFERIMNAGDRIMAFAVAAVTGGAIAFALYLAAIVISK